MTPAEEECREAWEEAAAIHRFWGTWEDWERACRENQRRRSFIASMYRETKRNTKP